MQAPSASRNPWGLPRWLSTRLVAVVAAALFGSLLCRLAAADNPADALREEFPAAPETLRPTPGWAARFVSEPAKAGRVPLAIDWADNAAERVQVTFGVPFANGVMADLARARIIDAEGNEPPSDWQTTAAWDGPEGPVRWALVHALLQKNTDYFLDYGPQVERAAPPNIAVRETDAAIEIDTGMLHATVSKSHPTVIESAGVRAGDQLVEIISPEQANAHLPFVVDAKGTRYLAQGADGGDWKVEVVEDGPLRVAVRREGWYADDQGTRFCGFVTYTYFFAGSAGVRHDHTLIVAFDSNRHQIRDIQLPLPVTAGKNAAAVFATDPSPNGTVFEAPQTDGPFRLVQTDHDSWTLRQRGRAVTTGRRAGGWFGLAGASGGLLAGLDFFWQQSPAELEIDGEVLRVHLWPPAEVPPLDLRPSAQLGEMYPGRHVFHGRWYRDGLDEMTQAYGLAKTHSLYLEFFAGPEMETAARRIRERVVAQVLALPDPEYVCATGVLFGRPHPRDPDRSPEIEEMLDWILDFYQNQRENHSQYGWIHFGDVFNSGQLWRRWASMFYGIPNVMPRLYLRSGKRQAREFHRANTRHITDIDLCHLDNEEFGKTRGLRYGGDGGIAHFAADLYATGPDHHLEFMLLDYYLGGNLRVREVADYYLAAHAARRATDQSLTTYAHRGTGGALRLFSQGYQATWNPEYLGIMRQLADILYRAQQELGAVRHDDVYMNQGIILYYQLTGDERMRELFLDNMETLAQRRNVYVHSDAGRGATMSGLAHAYWFTGDEKFLPFLLWQLDLAKQDGLGGLTGNRVAINATHGHQLPDVMTVLAEAADPPAPKGPAVLEPSDIPFALRTNWAVHLLKDRDEDLEAEVEVIPYDTAQAGAFPDRGRWLAALTGPERPALRVIGPSGREVQRIELLPPSGGAPELKPHAVKIRVPADGETGTVTIVPDGFAAPVSLRLVTSTADKRVAQTGENWVAPIDARSLFFLVPAGTGKFQIELKTARVRQSTQYGIRNAKGELAAENQWRTSATPKNQWEVIELDADKPEQDEVWSITFQFPSHQSQGQTWLRFEGIPPVVAASPSELFVPPPDRILELPKAEVPDGAEPLQIVAADLPWNGKAAWLAKPLTLQGRPEDGPLADEKQGTLEIWLKTPESPSHLADRNLLRMGNFGISRRYNIGTYLDLGGSIQRFFAFPNRRWTHLAVTWQPSQEEDADVLVRFFADGVEVNSTGIGATASQDRTVEAGWSDGPLVVPADLFLGGLRLSNVVRYDGDFERPQVPFEPDRNTRVLVDFSREPQALILGRELSLLPEPTSNPQNQPTPNP